MALDYNYSKLKGKVRLSTTPPSSVHNIPFLKFLRCQFFVNYDKKEPSQREVIRFFFSNRY